MRSPIQNPLTLLPRGLLLALLLAACDDADAGPDADVVAGEGDLIVAGTVERDEKPTAFNGAFVPTADAHIRITTRAYVGQDAPAELVAEADVPFAATLPFTYELRGTVDPAVLVEATLIVDVHIANHAGDDIAMGDLLSQTFIEAELGQTAVAVGVEGLESCDDPAVGGGCASP